MELSGSNIKKFLIFSQKKAFLIFWETKILKKFVIFQEMELSYISGNGNGNPKKLLIFLEMSVSPPPHPTPSSAHILSLVASCSNNSGLIFIWVKIMNLFACGEEISKLAVYSSKNYYSSHSAANLNIYQNIFKNCSLEIALSKNTFQKIFFENDSLSLKTSYISGRYLQSLKIKNLHFFSYFLLRENFSNISAK